MLVMISEAVTPNPRYINPVEPENSIGWKTQAGKLLNKLTQIFYRNLQSSESVSTQSKSEPSVPVYIQNLTESGIADLSMVLAEISHQPAEPTIGCYQVGDYVTTTVQIQTRPNVNYFSPEDDLREIVYKVVFISADKTRIELMSPAYPGQRTYVSDKSDSISTYLTLRRISEENVKKLKTLGIIP